MNHLTPSHTCDRMCSLQATYDGNRVVVRYVLDEYIYVRVFSIAKDKRIKMDPARKQEVDSTRIPTAFQLKSSKSSVQCKQIQCKQKLLRSGRQP